MREPGQFDRGGSDALRMELTRFIDYSTSIKIINFDETGQTRKLVKVCLEPASTTNLSDTVGELPGGR